MLKGFEKPWKQKIWCFDLKMTIGKNLLKTGTGVEVDGVVAELNTWMVLNILANQVSVYNKPPGLVLTSKGAMWEWEWLQPVRRSGQRRQQEFRIGCLGRSCSLHTGLLSSPLNTEEEQSKDDLDLSSDSDFDVELWSPRCRRHIRSYIITEVPTTLPRAGEPPVTEKDCAGLLAGEQKTMVADCSWFIFHLKYVQALLIITEHLCQDKQCTESHRSSFPSSHTQCSQCWTAGGPGEW